MNAEDVKIEDVSSLMIEAQSIVGGERQDMYGSPEHSFNQIAAMWNGILLAKLAPGSLVTPKDVTLMMAAMKLARETNKPKRDNLVDAHGYLLCAERVERAGR